MSLINLQNFVTPLTNKLHLGTILLVAVLFAVFRLAGGGWASMSTESSYEDQVKGRPSIDAKGIELDELFKGDKMADFGSTAAGSIDSNKKKTAAKVRPSDPSEGKVVESMLGNEKKDGKKPSKPASALDELEKSLGMR